MKESYTEFINTPAAFDMLWVEGGVFEMGNESGYSDSLPVHKVGVNSFWMGKFAVTQALWAYVMQENPSKFKGANRPVENVSYEDITNEFLPRLKTMTGLEYRLPSEAEWEYAAKGGRYGQKYPFEYAGSNKLEEVGWYGYDKKSHEETKVVGLKTPNLLGLFDMSGNVWEYCSDWYDLYPSSKKSAIVNPIGAISSTYHVLRGGTSNGIGTLCSCTFRRNDDGPIVRISGAGFRLVFSSSPAQWG